MQNKNLRIRGRYNCGNDIEENIKEIEKQYGINLKSLSQWRNIVKRINEVKVDCKNKLFNAKIRKYQIIENLFIQNYRKSPFVLSDNFSRTSKLRRNVKIDSEQENTSSRIEYLSPSLHNVSVDNVLLSADIDIESNAHPNTEVIQSKDQILKQYLEPDSSLNSPQYLPPVVCTNQHKILSSIRSSEIFLNYKESKFGETDFTTEAIAEVLLKQTKLVQCHPAKLIITSNTMIEQELKFTVLNTGTECINIQLKKISNMSYFKSFKLFPIVPIKLNPGLSKNYKFIFTLNDSIDVNDISLVIYFKICNKTAEEILCLPMQGQFEIYNSVVVTKTVNIPQVYIWQINAKCGYPKGILQIQVCAKTALNLFIRKKDVKFINKSENTQSIDSREVNTPNTESLMQKINDDEINMQDRTLLSPKGTEINVLNVINIESEELNASDIVTPVLDEIINIVFGPFIFKNTFLRLRPKSKRIVLVYFTTAEYIGYHQSYYDLLFCDSNDNVFVKTIKVFAEVLPHPVLIYPNILDLTKSPIIFGHSKDHFTIMNTHKVYPVSIKIKTMSKMNKIFQITPRTVLIPAKSNVNFNIKFCTEIINDSQNIEIMAYFTIKIIVNGHSSIYKNVPPLYYEIIAPCTNEFMKTYQIEFTNYTTALSPIETFENDYVNNA